MRKVNIIVALIFSIILLLCITVSAFSIENKIMEIYYDDGEYQYLINTATDVVYIRDQSSPHWGFCYLVPLYKPDGSLMTGEELKLIFDNIDENDEIVIYEERD